MLLLPKIFQERDIHTSTIGKVEEFLIRILISLSQNTTDESGDLLLFLYISVSPFTPRGKPIENDKNE